MKHTLSWWSFGMAVVCCLFGFEPTAQGNPTLSFTQDEIQRIVYTSHLMTVIDQSPEVEAALILLLEMERRNPEMDPDLIEALVRDALQGYRTDVRENMPFEPPRDVMLTEFLHYFVENMDTPSCRPVTLTILHRLLEDSYAATSGSSVRTHAGNAEVLGGEHALQHCQEEIDVLMQRAHTSARFRRLMDAILSEETDLSVLARPARILEVNASLGESPTLQFFANLYSAASGGTVTVEESELDSLFQLEMASMRETIGDNQTLVKTLNREQEELSEYLTDPLRLAAMQQMQQSARLGQAERIRAASAATYAISFSLRASTIEKAKQLKTLANSTAALARGMQAIDAATKFSKLTACTNFVSAGLGLVSLFIDTGPSAEEMILEEINALKKMIHDLATHVDYRFDRVDQTLNVILDQLDYSIQLIGETGHDVDELRLDLLDVEAGLCRLERELYNYLNAGFRRSFIERLNGDLQYEARTGEPMSWAWYRDTAENAFYSWAVSHSKDELSSYMPVAADLTDAALASQLQARPLESNLNYIAAFLHQRLGVPELSSKPVASPRDWFAGADAYLKLAVENPLHFRRMSAGRLDDVVKVGREVADFLGALSLQEDGTVNTPLFEALFDYYGGRVDNFMDAVETESVQHADIHMNHFAYTMWRDWDNAASSTVLREPAVTGTEKILQIPVDVVDVDGGGGHVLALRANGTVIAWGYNGSGQCDVPPEATDIVDVEAGGSHSLALKSDGTVLAWGYNGYGECDVPADLSDVVKIDAGPHHNMALRSDGTIAIWGYRTGAPELQIPEGLTDVIDIAAGGDTNRDTGSFCLALKSDGSVVAWGDNYYGQCDVPTTLANGDVEVVQVAAMMGQSAAVLANGSVIGWPELIIPNGLVEELSLFSWSWPVALRKDGSVEVLGDGSTEGMPTGNDIIQVSSGSGFGLALHRDGTVTQWPANNTGFTHSSAIRSTAGSHYNTLLLMQDGTVQVATGNLYPPGDLPKIRQLEVGNTGSYSGGAWALALTEEGTVVAWGNNAKGQCTVPEGLTDVVAVSAAYDGTHALALKRDGKVVAWGNNDFGQRNVPGDLADAVDISAGWRHSAALLADGTVRVWGSGGWYGLENIPDGLDDAVAISSGYTHMLALRSDGTVVAWGTNTDGACNVPAGLTDVVAIDAGHERSMALKADGTVVSWGADAWGARERANAMTGVYQIVCGGYRGDLFLVDNAFMSRDEIPDWEYRRRTTYTQVVTSRIADLYAYVLGELPYDLNDPARNMTAARQLLQAVVALALPDSFEEDDVLRGFLLGTEGLMDADTVERAYQREIERLNASRWARQRDVEVLFDDRLELFRERLYGHLDSVAASGQPELPRMVGHTLELLDILRTAHFAGETPAPVFDIAQLSLAPAGVTLPLYGEPYIHYRVDASNSLTGWEDTTLTIENGDGLFMPVSLSQKARFYRATAPTGP